MQPQDMALQVNSRDFVEVQTVLDQAISAGNPLIAAEYGNKLVRTTGVKLAKLLYGMKSNWSLFQAAGISEEFPDFVDAHMAVSGQTAVKYANMYEAVFANEEVPDRLKPHLANKPIEQLLLLTAAVREGSLDETDLEDVVVMDYNGIHAKVREVRGDVTKSKAGVYARLVQREHSVYPKGALVVFNGEGTEIEAIGGLNLTPRTKAGQQFLQRIINQMRLEDIR